MSSAIKIATISVIILLSAIIYLNRQIEWKSFDGLWGGRSAYLNDQQYRAHIMDINTSTNKLTVLLIDTDDNLLVNVQDKAFSVSQPASLAPYPISPLVNIVGKWSKMELPTNQTLKITKGILTITDTKTGKLLGEFVRP